MWCFVVCEGHLNLSLLCISICCQPFQTEFALPSKKTIYVFSPRSGLYKSCIELVGRGGRICPSHLTPWRPRSCGVEERQTPKPPAVWQSRVCRSPWHWEQGLDGLSLDGLSMVWVAHLHLWLRGLQSVWGDGRNVARKLICGAMFTVSHVASSRGSKIRSAFPLLTQQTGLEIKIVSNTLWIFSSSVEILRVYVFVLFFTT